jgi:signal transduction histidine kinase
LAQLSDALKQLRELARGIHPSSLTVGGLVTAVPELVRHSPVPIEARVSLSARLTTVVEATAYFFVSECLANLVRYSGANAGRVIVASSDVELVVEVSDDGRGGADAADGTGLRGLMDRVEALGGRMEVLSLPAHGTRVTAWIPLAPAPRAEPVR